LKEHKHAVNNDSVNTGIDKETGTLTFMARVHGEHGSASLYNHLGAVSLQWGPPGEGQGANAFRS